MNREECDLVTNEYWDCVDCEDREQCPYARNQGWVVVLIGVFSVALFCVALWWLLKQV